MIRLLISVAFALAVATSAEAMSPAPLHEPDMMITQIRNVRSAHQPCDLPSQVRINGICMLRSTPPRSADHKSTTSAQPTNRATFPVRYESMVSACCAPPPTMSADATTVGVRNGTKVYALSTTETLKPQGKFVPR